VPLNYTNCGCHSFNILDYILNVALRFIKNTSAILKAILARRMNIWWFYVFTHIDVNLSKKRLYQFPRSATERGGAADG
jgi:hypothetical protein